MENRNKNNSVDFRSPKEKFAMQKCKVITIQLLLVKEVHRYRYNRSNEETFRNINHRELIPMAHEVRA